MEIVTIKLLGYGCEVARGLINEKDYYQVKEITNNIWVKNLYNEVNQRVDVIEEIYEYGILSGDIIIEVDNKIVLDIPITILDTQDVVTPINYKTIKMDGDVMVTTLQYYEGLISDVTFVLDGKFDIKKLEVFKKTINNGEHDLVTDLYSELYYDGEKVPLTGVTTDLRMSEMFFD
jgi:hypothetical protein